MFQARRGFTLIEVALAIVVGLMIVSGSVYAYNQVNRSAHVSQARSMVGTIQTNIGMDKFRNGTPPPLTNTTPNPIPTISPYPCVTNNQDTTGKPYWPNTAAGSLPAEPITNTATILTFNSQATPGPIVAGDPSPAWDNPVFASPGAAGGYGTGGWLYDPATGAFRANLSNNVYINDHPSTW